MLDLELLEDRCSPSSLQITELPAPSNMWGPLMVQYDTAVLLMLGDWTGGKVGIPYSPNQVIQYDMPWSQWLATTGEPTPTTARLVVYVDGGEIPVILVPDVLLGPDAVQGISWELTSLQMGWWNQDAPASAFPPGHVYEHAYMPPGPEYGEPFSPPQWETADYLISTGDPLWFLSL